MSRTIKNSKGTGYDYWTARPGNNGGGLCNNSPHAGSRFTKKLTASRERQQCKAECVEGIMEDGTHYRAHIKW